MSDTNGQMPIYFKDFLQTPENCLALVLKNANSTGLKLSKEVMYILVAQMTSKLEVMKVSLFYGRTLRGGSSAVLWRKESYNTFLENSNLY